MNAFREHHEDRIRFGYRCFDRIWLNGLIQPFQQPERVVRFFTRYRDQYPVTRQLLRDIANHYHAWIDGRARERRIPILAEPKGGAMNASTGSSGVRSPTRWSSSSRPVSRPGF